jgi:hypothetical protein
MAEASGGYRIRVYLDVDFVGQGAGGSLVYNAAANNPGLGSVGVAQTLRLQQAEPVLAANPSAPTAAEFHTAVTQGATDLNTQINAALVATFQGWASGQP